MKGGQERIMADIEISLNADYPLRGTITAFESYMFATTDRHMEKHTAFDGEIVIVDGNRSVHTVRMDELSERKKALTQFNKYAKDKIPDIPKPTGLSCAMIDFISDGPCSDEEFGMPYEAVKKHFAEFMAKTDRVAVMVQHFHQDGRYPHLHILYQRRRGEHNAFQNHLADAMESDVME